MFGVVKSLVKALSGSDGQPSRGWPRIHIYCEAEWEEYWALVHEALFPSCIVSGDRVEELLRAAGEAVREGLDVLPRARGDISRKDVLQNGAVLIRPAQFWELGDRASCRSYFIEDGPCHLCGDDGPVTCDGNIVTWDPHEGRPVRLYVWMCQTCGERLGAVPPDAFCAYSY